jgi:hypothetical protein
VVVHQPPGLVQLRVARTGVHGLLFRMFCCCRCCHCFLGGVLSCGKVVHAHPIDLIPLLLLLLLLLVCCRGPFSGGKVMHAHLCGRLHTI